MLSCAVRALFRILLVTVRLACHLIHMLASTKTSYHIKAFTLEKIQIKNFMGTFSFKFLYGKMFHIIFLIASKSTLYNTNIIALANSKLISAVYYLTSRIEMKKERLKREERFPWNSEEMKESLISATSLPSSSSTFSPTRPCFCATLQAV